MEIVCATDRNYIMPIGVMLTSLFESNMGEVVNVHLLHDKASANFLKPLESLALSYQQTINFYQINNDAFKEFPIGLDYQLDHVGTSLATYYRLILSEILPDHIDKVIYLDGDTLVVDNLLDLWNTDISDYALGAVPDSFTNKIEHYNRLRYPQSKGYFNAGVLLINLRYWREHHVVAKFWDYVKYNPRRLRCHDQDVLNVLFMDAKYELPFRYNMLNEYCFNLQYTVVSWEYDSLILKAQEHPAIIHFTCIPKPWYKNSKHPYKKVFDAYRAISPWKKEKQKYWCSWKYCLEKLAIQLVVALGLRKQDYIVENRYIHLS